MQRVARPQPKQKRQRAAVALFQNLSVPTAFSLWIVWSLVCAYKFHQALVRVRVCQRKEMQTAHRFSSNSLCFTSSWEGTLWLLGRACWRSCSWPPSWRPSASSTQTGDNQRLPPPALLYKPPRQESVITSSAFLRPFLVILLIGELCKLPKGIKLLSGREQIGEDG
jgi:hypothetical protein